MIPQKNSSPINADTPQGHLTPAPSAPPTCSAAPPPSTVYPDDPQLALREQIETGHLSRNEGRHVEKGPPDKDNNLPEEKAAIAIESKLSVERGGPKIPSNMSKKFVKVNPDNLPSNLPKF